MRPHLYKRPCPLVGSSVSRWVGWSVMLLSKSMKNRLSRILNDLDRAGQGKKEEQGGRRGEEEKGARRKERRGE